MGESYEAMSLVGGRHEISKRENGAPEGTLKQVGKLQKAVTQMVMNGKV